MSTKKYIPAAIAAAVLASLAVPTAAMASTTIQPPSSVIDPGFTAGISAPKAVATYLGDSDATIDVTAVANASLTVTDSSGNLVASTYVPSSGTIRLYATKIEGGLEKYRVTVRDSEGHEASATSNTIDFPVAVVKAPRATGDYLGNGEGVLHITAASGQSVTVADDSGQVVYQGIGNGSGHLDVYLASHVAGKVKYSVTASDRAGHVSDSTAASIDFKTAVPEKAPRG